MYQDNIRYDKERYTDARINLEISYKAAYISSKQLNNHRHDMVPGIYESHKVKVGRMVIRKKILFDNRGLFYVAENV